MVGQGLVVTTLKNAIITNQISHAYLFAGPRGTGKTSAAKIFAKAINCHHQTDGEPCNECPTCQAITAGQLGDVIEIDAASNNGVEEIRDIRDKAKYAPTQADYKVYIIDEVHMLSTGAFNALLKTLEEPPANVIFILATTEPHKIPLTILSRVQRFDFHRISAQDAFERMKFILDQKDLAYDEQALWVIANAAEGGMRDALSILDQALSFSDNQLALKDALLVTGSVTKQLLKQYFLQVAQGDSAQALATMTEVLGQGKDGQRFIEDLISFIRDILLYQESPDLLTLAATGLAAADFEELSQAAAAPVLYTMIDTLNEIQEEMRFTTHPDVYLEVLTVRLSQQRPASSAAGAAPAEIAQLQAQIAELQKQVQSLLNRPAQPATPASQPTVRSAAKKPGGRSGEFRLTVVQVYKLDTPLRRIWPTAGAVGRRAELAFTGPTFLLNSKPVAASPAGVVVAYDNDFLLAKAAGGDLATTLGQALQQVSGTARQVAFVPSGKWPTIRQEFLTSRGYYDQAGKAAAPKAPTPPADPLIAQAQQLFGADGIKIEDN